jgi:type II secretory pathway component PulK
VKWPKTYLGFPVEEPDLSPEEGSNPTSGEPNRKRRGIALLIAVMLISVMMIFSVDLIIGSQVNLELASRQRDSLSAEYLAKSGLNLGRFLLAMDYGIDMFQAIYMKTPMSDGIGDAWAILNDFPIGSSTAELAEAMQEGFGLSKVMDKDVLASLSSFSGVFTIQVQDESNKINLNQCTNQTNCRQLMKMLEGLFSCPVEMEFLEKRDLTPTKLAALIRDYIDKDSSPTSEGGYNDETAPYSRSDPKYGPKNAPLDSLDELLMVDGWSDDLHAIFSPYLTVFPVPARSKDKMQINLNTASRELLSCLIPEARDLCAEKSAVGLYSREKMKSNLVSKGVDETLKDLFCHNSDEKDKKSEWFNTQSRVFAVEAIGESGAMTRTISAVVERRTPNPSKPKPFDDGAQVTKVLSWQLR